MMREAKTLLVLMVAFWGIVGALQNVAHWGETIGAVGAVASMSTHEGGAASWQATSNPGVLWAGALLIVLSKLAAGSLCGIGAVRMWRARAASAATFTAAKGIAITGCMVAMIMLFGGFIVIAESWFELWRSDAMRGPVLDSAFRYGGMIALIALLLATPDAENGR
jgi:predicted small integral membrane protein